MELGGYGFEKPELLKLAEEIYELKSKKQELELTLHSEQFHQQYIPKRKQLAEHEVTFRLLWIIPITILVVSSLIFILCCMFDSESIDGLSLLFCSIFVAFGGYAAFKLWKREIHMLKLLWLSKNPEKAIEFSDKHDITTFQSDEEASKQRIAMLEEEITGIDAKLKQLEEQHEQLLEAKKKGEDFLKEQGVLFDETPNVPKPEGKFSLREESMGGGDIRDLFEYYSREEQYNRNYLQKLDIKLQQINKQITQIDEDVDNVKKMCIFFVCVYVLLVIIQSAFSGVLGGITSVICMAISVYLIVYAESKGKMPVILYLVEHEHPMIQEYAFCHNMVPVRIKREELMEKMDTLRRELDNLKEKKRALDI